MARTPTLAPVFYLDLIGFDFTLTLSWIDRYLSVDQREAPVARLISDSAPRLFTCREGRPAQDHVFGLEGAPKVKIILLPLHLDDQSIQVGSLCRNREGGRLQGGMSALSQKPTLECG